MTANPIPEPNLQMKKITAERSAMIAVVANVAFRFVMVVFLLSAAVRRLLYSLFDVDGVIGNRVLLCPRVPPGIASGLEFRITGTGCVTAYEALGTVLTRGDHRLCWAAA